MLQLVYASAATAPFTADQLVALLDRAREKNHALGIGGLLLYHQGSFLQAIEGPDLAVARLAAEIERDPRHHRMKVLLRRDVACGTFGGWSMGFVNTEGCDLTDLPGYLDYLTDFKAAADLRHRDRAWWILDRFRNGQWRQYVATGEPAPAAG